MDIMNLFHKKEYAVEFYLVDAFEIYHFLPIYNYLRKNGISCCFVAEPPKRNSSKNWFDYDNAIKILKINHVEYKKRANYEAQVVFTTQDERLIHNYKNKKVHMNYGNSLEVRSFCESEKTAVGFDLKLVHGQLGYDVINKKFPDIDIIQFGYPKYSSWSDKSVYMYDNTARIEEIIKENTESKPVLLYFPTWNTRSSIDAYAEVFMKLKEHFFIITKAHHCTFRLWRERERLEKLKQISDVMLEGNFSFKEAVALGNIAVVDAISSAATEVPYVKNDIKLILLYSPIEEENCFKEIIDDFSICVKKPDELENAIKELVINDAKLETRQRLLSYIYADNDSNSLQSVKEYIVNSTKD